MRTIAVAVILACANQPPDEVALVEAVAHMTDARSASYRLTRSDSLQSVLGWDSLKVARLARSLDTWGGVGMPSRDRACLEAVLRQGCRVLSIDRVEREGSVVVVAASWYYVNRDGQLNACAGVTTRTFVFAESPEGWVLRSERPADYADAAC